MADATDQQPNKTPASGGGCSVITMGTTFICLLIYLMTMFLKPINLTLRFHEFAYEEKNEVNHQTPLVEAGNIKEIKPTNEMIL